MKRSLSDYALIAEIVSAIAVVVTLIIIAYQLRLSASETALNTAAIRAQTYQDLAFEVSDNADVQLNNPALVELIVRTVQGEPYRNYEDQYVFITYLFSLFRKGSIAFGAYEEGLINDEELMSLLQLPRTHTITVAGKPIWELYGPTVNADYVAFMNAMQVRCPAEWVCTD